MKCFKEGCEKMVCFEAKECKLEPKCCNNNCRQGRDCPNRKPFPIYWFVKGPTAYEAQFGRLVIRICHLRGAFWRFKPWRRISVRIWPKDSTPNMYSEITYDGSNFLKKILSEFDK